MLPVVSPTKDYESFSLAVETDALQKDLRNETIADRKTLYSRNPLKVFPPCSVSYASNEIYFLGI